MLQNKVTQAEGLIILTIMRFLGYDVPVVLIGIIICLMIVNFIAVVLNKKINSILSNKILIERDMYDKQIEDLKQKDREREEFLKEIANLKETIELLTKEQETQAKHMEEQSMLMEEQSILMEEQSRQIEEQSKNMEEQAKQIEELDKGVKQKDQQIMDILSNVTRLQEKIIILTEELYIQNNNNNINNKTAYNYNYKPDNHKHNNNNYNEDYYYNEDKY